MGCFLIRVALNLARVGLFFAKVVIFILAGVGIEFFWLLIVRVIR